MKELTIKQEGCVGCQACEMICSATHEGGFNPKYARIKVPARLPLPISPKVCIFCEDAPCIDSCPSGSLSRQGRSPLVIDKDTCTGCMICIDACPYEGLFFDHKNELPISCDLCEGNPKCINICPVDIISW